MNDSSVFIYSGKNGAAKVSARFADDDVWLTQQQLAEIYETSQQNISLHLKTIYEDGELLKEATYKDFLLVQKEGGREVKRRTAWEFQAVFLCADGKNHGTKSENCAKIWMGIY